MGRIADAWGPKRISREAAAGPAYYHGTRYDLSPGDILEGGARPANNPGVGRYEHVYMARSPMEAHAAGSLAYDALGYRRGQPNVYEVAPLDEVERDPFTKGAVRSKRARVLRKVDPFEDAYEADGEQHLGARRKRDDLGPVTYSHVEEKPGSHRFDAHDKYGNNVGYAQAYEKPGHVFLDSVYVVPGARGHGVASRLLGNAIGHFPDREMRLKPEPFEDNRWLFDDTGQDEDQLREFYGRHGFEDDDYSIDGHMVRHAALAREAAYEYPQSETGPLYHGTTQERAQRILEHGFEQGSAEHHGVIFFTRHPDLAMDYARGRVQRDGGGTPVVLRAENVRGVSAEHTGYSSPKLNREHGAHYMDQGPHVLVLDPAAIHDVTWPEGQRKTAARDEKPTKSKAQVNYRPSTGRKKCDNCTMIRLKAPDFESHGCTLVKGIIDPDAVCDEWYPEEGIEKEAAFEDEEPAYYHVSPHRLPYGTILKPPGHGAGNWDEDQEGQHVYVTPHEHRADQYHYLLWQQGHRDLHVYQVRPQGKLEQDPHDIEGLRTKDPVEVVNHLYGHDEDEDDDDWFYPQHHTAASDYEGLTKRSGMIYLDLPEGAVQQVPGGVDDHHVTICYLGPDVDDDAFAEARRRAEQAASVTSPLHGLIHGVDTFPASDSSDGKIPAFIPAYIPDIGKLRQMLEDLSASEHRHYRPHVTLGYFKEGEELPPPHPPVKVSFDRLFVKRGDDVVSYPFRG